MEQQQPQQPGQVPEAGSPTPPPTQPTPQATQPTPQVPQPTPQEPVPQGSVPQSDQAPPSDPRSQSSDTDEKQEAEALWERTKHYAIIGAVCLVGALIAAAVIPRWWAQRLGDVADGSITVGSLLGIAMGLLGTIIPVWLVSSAIRNRNSERSALWYVIPAAVLAIPMLATLWIALGAGNGAEAGRDTLNVEAPGVRGGTYVGALVGLALAITLIFKLRAKRKEKEAANQAK